MLKPLDTFLDILQDPCSGMQLTGSAGRYTVAGSETPLPMIAGKPILVAQERSIIDIDQALQQQGASDITRTTNSAKAWIKKALWKGHVNAEARQQCEVFVKSLKDTNPSPRVLIIGGGERGIGTEQLYDDPDIEVVSFDVYVSPNTQLIADAHDIPFRDCSVDGVWIQYVIEHVIDPFRVAEEMHRVTKEGGIIYSETPFMQQVHEAAYDFMRFSHSGHRWLFRKFDEIDSGVAMGTGTQLLWTIEHLARGIFRSKSIGKIFKILFFWTRFLDQIVTNRCQMDSASSFYFFGKKSASELTQKELIEYYSQSRP